jgi:hypothetical protein
VHCELPAADYIPASTRAPWGARNGFNAPTI